MSPQKWIKSTNAIGLISKSGRYGGGTLAHKDIAFEFASWLSPEFKLYIIKDYQRLKEDESHQKALDWNVKRILVSANYRIHTDAIKENLIPQELSRQQQSFVYADETDLLNVVLFGKTAKQWRLENPGLKGNLRCRIRRPAICPISGDACWASPLFHFIQQAIEDHPAPSTQQWKVSTANA